MFPYQNFPKLSGNFPDTSNSTGNGDKAQIVYAGLPMATFPHD